MQAFTIPSAARREVISSGRARRATCKANTSYPSRTLLRASGGPPVGGSGGADVGDTTSRSAAAGEKDDARERLRLDVENFRARKASSRARNDAASSENRGGDTMSAAKSAFDTLLVWNFFLVVALLSWLLVALVPHFAAKNDVLLDPWLAIWQPFIQPVLGVLMLSTIGQGMWSYMFTKE
jgi:hypothetical protein